MARRSLADMARITARVPRGDAGYWSIMLRLSRAGSGEFTVPEVEAETNTLTSGTVAIYLRKLIAGGFVRHVGNRPGRAAPKVYRLLKSPSEAPRLDAKGKPFGPPVQQCLWNAMRHMRMGFDAAGLAYAATVDRKIPVNSAARYCRQLEAAGYLARVGNQRTPLWRLKPAMNSGPLAPAIIRVDGVWDRNTKRLVGPVVHDAREVA